MKSFETTKTVEGAMHLLNMDISHQDITLAGLVMLSEFIKNANQPDRHRLQMAISYLMSCQNN